MFAHVHRVPKNLIPPPREFCRHPFSCPLIEDLSHTQQFRHICLAGADCDLAVVGDPVHAAMFVHPPDPLYNCVLQRTALGTFDGSNFQTRTGQ